MHWLCNNKWSCSWTRPASTLRVTWTTGSSCSAVSTKSPAPLASSATPHSSSPTSSSNDESHSMMTREQTASARFRAFFSSVITAPRQGLGQHRRGRVHGGGRVYGGGAADAERPDRVLQAARLGAGARGEAVSSAIHHQTAGPVQGGGESATSGQLAVRGN